MPTDNKTGSNGRFSEKLKFDAEKHIYTYNNVIVPSVTEILAPLHRSYGTINQQILEYAAARGTAVHEACQDIDCGDEPDIDFDTEPYITAYLDWLSLYDPVWTGIEKLVFNKIGWYAGTLDRIGYLNGEELAIVDIKTSQPTREAYTSVCLQTAAYAAAVASEDGFSPDWKDYNRYGLFLMKDGKYRLLDCKEFEGTNHFDSIQAFAVLRATHRMVTNLLETKGRKQHE